MSILNKIFKNEKLLFNVFKDNLREIIEITYIKISSIINWGT